MPPIANYDTYTSGMKKSIRDKLFFEDLVEGVNTVIDYGCADGRTLAQIHQDFPEWNLVGIDADANMLEGALKNCGSADYLLANNIPEEGKYAWDFENAVFNLSSVIHEIYSYSSEASVDEFWKRLFNSGVKYVSIRDLMLSQSAFRDSDMNDVAAILHNGSGKGIEEFCSIWGNLSQQNNLLHYLMKYRYTENWEREVKEDYFPITVEQLLGMIPTDKYKVVYFKHYILPFTKDRIFNDFGIEVKDGTHVKILLERAN